MADAGPTTEAGVPVQALARAAAVFLVSRIVVFTAMGAATVIAGHTSLRDAITHWDGGWYLTIVSGGYARSVPHGAGAMTNVAFFPLFPLAVRFVARLGLSPFRAAVMVNLLTGTLAALGVWLVASRLFDRQTADRAVALFAFFPASFVLSMIYSEALMLALATACLWALLTRRWWVAGLASALATAARPNAVALCAACAVGGGVAVLQRREWRSLVAPALSPIGGLAYMAFVWHHTNDTTAWFRAQGAWGQGFDFGSTTARVLFDTIRHPGQDLNKLVASLSLVFVVATFVLLVRSRPPAVVSVYASTVIALQYLSPLIASRPRAALTAFPLVIALARGTRGQVYATVLASGAVLLACLTMISVMTLAITP